LRCEVKNQTAMIAVEDHGIGIPKTYQRELFQKFTQAMQPVRKKVASTGLGLAIVKSIVEAHNGRVYFTTKEGVGTTFYIELPLAVSNPM
jgi:two-component system, OmpR family, sensor histidine kinase VicK